MKRYIVLGLERDIVQFRRDRGLRMRDVIGVSTRCGDLALRGLGSGDYQVITLDSWSHATERVKQAVKTNLAIMSQVVGCTII